VGSSRAVQDDRMTDELSWTRRTVQNGDVALAVFEAGNPDRPPLVMVHGWPDTHLVWTGVAQLLEDDFRLVAYDTRGQGESDEPEDDAAYELTQLAQDFRAVVDAVSPDVPVHVLAHDWGSVEVWEAVTTPEHAGRVASFTSISGPDLDHLAQWGREQLTRLNLGGVARVLEQGAASAYTAFMVSPLAPPAFKLLANRAVWQELLHRVEGVQPSDQHHGPTLEHDMVSGLRRYRANLFSRARKPSPRGTSVPVLQVVPTRDLAVRPAALRAAEPYVEHLERQEVPYGHWVVLAHPEVVADAVRGFVAGLST
jgi:pimeloyl-ACP methyl ester carboxylesterase